VYAAQRWTLEGERVVERLVFGGALLAPSAVMLPVDDAERLVTLAALAAAEWINAPGELEGDAVAATFTDIVESIDGRYVQFVESARRENRDRVRFQLEQLARHQATKEAELQARIRTLHAEQKLRLVPALEGQIRRLHERTQNRRVQLESKQELRHYSRLACGGVIDVH
jgi:hypothetical protein